MIASRTKLGTSLGCVLTASVSSLLMLQQPLFCSSHQDGVDPGFALTSFFDPNQNQMNNQETDCYQVCQTDTDCEPICVETPCCIEELLSRIQIGGSYTYVRIKPHGNPSFHGNLGGAQATYEYRPINRFYGAATVTWKQGDTHGSAGKRSLLYIDAQEKLGYTFANECDDWRITFFSGFGYRHFSEKLRPKIDSPIWFRYDEFYFPVGFLTNYAVTTRFSLGIDFTWMPQVYPTVTIVPLKGARWIITNQLSNFYVALPITFALTCDERFSLILKPFYERWNDGHTTAKLSDGTPLGLPGNTYNFYGAELNFAFSF